MEGGGEWVKENRGGRMGERGWGIGKWLIEGFGAVIVVKMCEGGSIAVDNYEVGDKQTQLTHRLPQNQYAMHEPRHVCVTLVNAYTHKNSKGIKHISAHSCTRVHVKTGTSRQS